ncbi:MAG: hypothetical protein U5Q44_08200 [Dehalococcoidia bacterium]|nr:hypothetical protein [Dehalococcoidia bacterium]
MDIFRDPTYGKRNRAVAIILGALILGVPLALWVIARVAPRPAICSVRSRLFAVLAFLGRHMLRAWHPLDPSPARLHAAAVPKRARGPARDRATYQRATRTSKERR